MSKVLNVVFYIPLMFAAFFLIFWIRIVQNENVSFDEFVLEKQANYAADAAVEELLYTGKLNQDYNNGDYILIEPDLGKDEFISILEYSFGYIPTEFTDSMFMNKYLRALVICGWDGYYTYWRMETDTNEYDLVSTPKVPYFYTDAYGTQWCLNLGLEKAWAGGTDAHGKFSIATYKNMQEHADKYSKGEKPTRDAQLTAINNQVGNALNYALYQSYSDGHMQKAYEIPNLASKIKGAQTVDKITVLGVVEGAATSSTSTVVAECIGGAKITSNDQVYAVTIKNFKKQPMYDAKVYATASQWKKLIGNADDLKVGATCSLGKIESAEYFDNCFKAAEAGYHDLMVFEGGANNNE